MSAREILIESQSQNDMDGVTISVSRQALHEFIGEFDTLRKRCVELEGSMAIAMEALYQLRDIVNGSIKREDVIHPIQLISVNTVVASIQELQPDVAGWRKAKAKGERG